MSDSENFEAFWFTPSRYRVLKSDSEDGTPEYKDGSPCYKLQPMNGIEVADYVGRIDINERGVYVFHKGVVLSLISNFCQDWRGLKYKGGEVEYSLKSLGKVPGHDLHACAGAIIDKSYFSEDDLKN